MQNHDNPPTRRGFRFSLRTLFVLLTLFGVWLGLRLKWLRDRQAALTWIAQHGNWAANDGQLTYAGRGTIKVGPLSNRVRAPLSLRLLNETGIAVITVAETQNGNADAEKIRELQSLFPEATISRRP